MGRFSVLLRYHHSAGRQDSRYLLCNCVEMCDKAVRTQKTVPMCPAGRLQAMPGGRLADASAPGQRSRKGLATFWLKNSMSGPMKKAVMIVPMPTSPRICFSLNPASLHSATPPSTQTKSVITRQMGNLIRLCFSDQISASAS